MLPRILITDANSLAALSLLRALSGEQVQLFAAADSGFAAGLYLVVKSNRLVLPSAEHPAFIPELFRACRENQISAVVPTCKAELLPLARARRMFQRAGIRLVLSPERVLERCRDHVEMVRVCSALIPTPRTQVLDASAITEDWEWPVVVKSRHTGVDGEPRLIASLEELRAVGPSASLVVQEQLPGAEIRIGVFADRCRQVVAAVPRMEHRTRSQDAVVWRTIKHEPAVRVAMEAASRLGLVYSATVVVRMDADGLPTFLSATPISGEGVGLTVCSGANTPLMALNEVSGVPHSTSAGDYQEVGMVRSRWEHYVAPHEIDALLVDKAISVSTTSDFQVVPRAGCTFMRAGVEPSSTSGAR